MDPSDGDEPNEQASGLSQEEAKKLYKAASELSPEEREHLLHLHRNENLGPLLHLALTRPEFICRVLLDSMRKEEVHDYVTDIDTRMMFFRRLMKIINNHELSLQLNATVFAIFMVAPLESLESRLASLERDLQTNKKDELLGKGGRPPGTKTVSEDDSPASSVPASTGAADHCKLRDGQECVITGTSHPEAAYIFPSAGTFNILSTLQTFWDDETVSRVSTLIQDRNIIESPQNLISLNRQVQYWFDKGFMALKPLRKHNDGTVDVQLHWLKGSLLSPKQTLSTTDDIQTSIISAGIEKQCWGDVTANRSSGLPLETGQTFQLSPGIRPTVAAPDFDLLKLSWDLLRVAAISGAAEFVELLIPDRDDDDDDDDETDCFEIQTQEDIYRESDYARLYQWQREVEQGEENPNDNGKSSLEEL